ncbi:hypothetical protein Aeh1ORF076c [Aeromonas phage Aeh1]|uniref:Uncharacterized protein n=1 Tax=Aeromonas phage Aeh1 TaxID=2880362 RepID=Q76Z10_9CAUD|nr:hypothetical protein Aeh1p081 [Aeromonas phage Aeh1]AAQ17736.1 hypothetical protein Aeh1ORF076c [Aeromonas phage Aeh1]
MKSLADFLAESHMPGDEQLEKDQKKPVYSKNQVVELTKEQEFELSKRSKLATKMKVGVYDFMSSIHAQARAAQRRNDVSPEDWKAFYRKIAHYVEDQKIRNGQFMFHSKGMDISVAGRVRNRQIEIATVYPKGTAGFQSKKRTEMGQKQAIFESVDDFYESVESADWIEEAENVLGESLTDVVIVK